MGELTEPIQITDLQMKIEARDLRMFQIENLQFLTTKEGARFLEGCKRQMELFKIWDAERMKNFGVHLGEPAKEEMIKNDR